MYEIFKKRYHTSISNAFQYVKSTILATLENYNLRVRSLNMFERLLIETIDVITAMSFELVDYL